MTSRTKPSFWTHRHTYRTMDGQIDVAVEIVIQIWRSKTLNSGGYYDPKEKTVASA